MLVQGLFMSLARQQHKYNLLALKRKSGLLVGFLRGASRE